MRCVTFQFSEPMDIAISGQEVGMVLVGGEAEEVGDSIVVHNGLVGCVKVSLIYTFYRVFSYF